MPAADVAEQGENKVQKDGASFLPPGCLDANLRLRVQHPEPGVHGHADTETGGLSGQIAGLPKGVLMLRQGTTPRAARGYTHAQHLDMMHMLTCRCMLRHT